MVQVSPRVSSAVIPKGASVIGADGVRMGMVSALLPDVGEPTHLLVFVAERTQLIPWEYPLPLTAIVRVSDGDVHVDVTSEAFRFRPNGAAGDLP